MDFLISLVFSNPYIPWILLALAVFFVYQKVAARLSVRAPAGGVSVNDWMERVLGPRFAERKLQKEVERYKKEANYLAAGKLLEDHGDLAEAVEAYSSGSEYWAAASVLERMGRGETFHRTPVGVLFGEKAGERVEDPYFGGAGPRRTTCTECGSCPRQSSSSP